MSNPPLKLDWSSLLPANEAGPPEEVVVIPPSAEGGVGGGGGGGQWGNVPDQKLHEMIDRYLWRISSGIAEKLPDKGAKLKITLDQLQGELDSRKLVKCRRRKEDAEESAGHGRFKTTQSSGVCHDYSRDSSPSCMPKESRSESTFASLFSKRIESRSSMPPNGGCRSNGEVKCRSSKKSGKPPHEIKQPFATSSKPVGTSSRSSRFLDANRLANKDKKNSAINYCSVTESCSHPVSPAGKNYSISNSERKRASDDRGVLQPSLKKVQVVLLDEEELEPKQHILTNSHNDWKEAKVYFPSRDDPECIELSLSDIKCLDPEAYLTSPIMNFYIRYLQRPLSPLGKPRSEYYFFNTYFFSKLEEAVSCKGDRDKRFMKLRRWLKGVNIFQKAYIFLPIHGNMHWSLVIICIPAKEDESGPIVLHLDSLGMHDSTKIFSLVFCYLEEEWNNMNQNGTPPDLPISERIWGNLPCELEKKKLKVPQQKNEYDCGLFVLYFMERFIEEAPERLKRKDLEMFGSKWFHPEEASGLRKRIRDLLIEEFENAKWESGREESPNSSSCNSLDNVEQPIVLDTNDGS